MGRKKQIGASIFFIVVAILYLIGTLSIKTVNIFGVTVVSSSTIPRVLGVLLLILSVVLLIKTLTTGKNSQAQAEKVEVQASGAVTSEDGQLDIAKSLEEAENSEGEGDVDYLSIVLTLASLILFTILLDPLGFILSSFIYMVLQTTILTKKAVRLKKLPITIVFSLVFSVVVYFLFTKGLSLMLPAGILG